MATGTVLLMPNAAVFPDGSTNNAAPGMTRRQGSQTTRKGHYLTLDFDGAGSTVESCHWQFRLPANYSSAPVIKILWHANATSNAVKWQTQVAAVTPDDADTPLEHAYATADTVTTNVNTTEARRLTASSITVSNADSMAAGDFVQIVLFRDPADAADTATVDAEVVAVAFEYTTT